MEADKRLKLESVISLQTNDEAIAQIQEIIRKEDPDID
jgi:hypothetical protein